MISEERKEELLNQALSGQWEDNRFKTDMIQAMREESFSARVAETLGNSTPELVKVLSEHSSTWPTTTKDGKIVSGERKKLKYISFGEILDMDVPPVNWIVKDILAPGLTILASEEKYGKSYMILDLCIRVATGQDFFGKGTNGGCGVLYLDLENGQRKTNRRTKKAYEPGSIPSAIRKNLQYHDMQNETPTIDGGLIQEMQGALEDIPNLRLIVIDTLQKVREGMASASSQYAKDYSELAPLQEFAVKNDVCVLVTSHVTKLNYGDPIKNIRGVTGPVVDDFWVLQKESRDAMEARLYLDGRNFDDGSITLNLKRIRKTGMWECLGTDEEVADDRVLNKYLHDPLFEVIRKQTAQDPEWHATASELKTLGTSVFKITIPDDPKSIGVKLRENAHLMKFHDRIEYINGDSNKDRRNTFRRIAD